MITILLALSLWCVFSLALIPLVTRQIHVSPQYGASAPKKERRPKVPVVKA